MRLCNGGVKERLPKLGGVLLRLWAYDRFCLEGAASWTGRIAVDADTGAAAERVATRACVSARPVLHTVIRFRAKDGEIAVDQEGDRDPFFDRIAIRHITEGAGVS